MTEILTQPQLTPRKEPRQKRSRATVDAIIEATARVLVEEGYDKASTNRIAAVAGVSVGSLYQYFPSKEALLWSLCERHSQFMLDQLRALEPVLLKQSIPDTVRAYVRTMVATHAVRPELHRVVMAQMIQLQPARILELEKLAIDLVRSLLARVADDILPTDLDTAAFVLVTAVESITHRAVLGAPERLNSSALEDEICALVLRYLLGSA